MTAKRRAVITLLVAMAFVAATTLGFAEGQKEGAKSKTVSTEDLTKSLPAELKGLYANVAVPAFPSPYDNFKPKNGPWKIGYADSYQGNPWRVAVKDELIRLADVFKKAGKVESIESKVSNNDVSQEIANIRSFIDKKVDIIILNPESPSALNGVIKEAYDAGIPVVTIAATVTSPYAINVDQNYYVWGYNMADSIGKALKGKGNVLRVDGIAGVSIVDDEGKGFTDALKKYPDVKMVAKVNGNWTLSVTKQVVLQTLATTTEPIDAVWTTGSEARVVFEAFKEAGKPVPLVTGSITGDSLGYWKKYGDSAFKFYGYGVLPHFTAETGFRVAMRMLEGQKPKLTLIEIPLPEITQDTLAMWYTPAMTPDTTSVFPIPPKDPISEESMNAYFVGGKALAEYDYSQVPAPGK